MLTDVTTAIAPAGTGGTGTAPMPGAVLPAACSSPWSPLPGIGGSCAGLLSGGASGALGGAMLATPSADLAAIAVLEPTAPEPTVLDPEAAFGVVRFRTVQHVNGTTSPTGTTLGNHSPGRPTS